MRLLAARLKHFRGLSSLAAVVQNNEMRISYAQNLLSTVNIVLLAVRQDRKTWLSPS